MKYDLSKKPLKIIWAIDILSTEKNLKKADEKFLQAIGKKTAMEVLPVYVAHVENQPAENGDGKGDFLSEVRQRMSDWLGQCKVPGLQDPEALLRGGIYLRADVDALHKLAKKQKADLILVNTHARRGLSRFWQGSFAESLMYHSSLPVLFINPSAKVPSFIRTVIYPTNLSPDAEKAVLRVGELASRIGASLVLYNNVEYFVASPSLSFSETFVFDRQIKTDVSERKKNLQKLAGKIEKLFGIEVKTVVDAEDFTAAEGILKKSKKTPSSMIAMLSQTGPVLSHLVGSTTRRVIRKSEEPVFVLK